MLLWDLLGKFPGTDYESFNYEWVIGKLKELKDSVAAALASEQAAAESASNASGAAGLAMLYRNAAKNYRDEAEGFANDSAASANSIASVVDQINSNTSRIDTLVAHAGDTDGNSELLDIRVGYDGTIYETAGDAVREQVEDLHDDLDDFVTIRQKPNMFNKDDVIEGAYYNPQGDIVENSSFNYSPTYSEVLPSTTYYARYYNGLNWATARVAIAWYDIAKNFISQGYNLDQFLSPANAKYVRISYHISLGNDTLVFADFPATSEQEWGYEYALQDYVVVPGVDNVEKGDVLHGKTLCCVGDSITYGADMDSDGITNVSDITVYNCDNAGNFTETHSGFRKTFGWQIANRHDMVFYNGGISGSTMQGLADHNGFSLANGRYTKLPDNIDYLLIWFGWNDTAYGTLGTINDNTNETFFGAYNVVMPYLINKYPYTKIAIVVPFGTDEGHRNAIRALGDKWGVAVWDNYYGGTPLYYGKEPSVNVNPSIVTSNRAKFQANGAHPNYKGHTQLADMIEGFLIGI